MAQHIREAQKHTIFVLKTVVTIHYFNKKEGWILIQDIFS